MYNAFLLNTLYIRPHTCFTETHVLQRRVYLVNKKTLQKSVYIELGSPTHLQPSPRIPRLRTNSFVCGNKSLHLLTNTQESWNSTSVNIEDPASSLRLPASSLQSPASRLPDKPTALQSLSTITTYIILPESCITCVYRDYRNTYITITFQPCNYQSRQPNFMIYCVRAFYDNYHSVLAFSFFYSIIYTVLSNAQFAIIRTAD